MSLTRSVAPAEMPLTLADLKDHLRITVTTQDAEVLGYLRAVVDRLDGTEGILDRALITQTWVLKLDAFPRGAIRLPLPPAQSVTSITYTDTAGDAQTLTASKYTLLNANTPTRAGMIEEAYGETWPSTRAEGEAVTVTWVCGYGLRESVPEMTRHLIKLLAADAFRQREAATQGGLKETPSMMGLLSQARYYGAI